MMYWIWIITLSIFLCEVLRGQQEINASERLFKEQMKQIDENEKKWG